MTNEINNENNIENEDEWEDLDPWDEDWIGGMWDINSKRIVNGKVLNDVLEEIQNGLFKLNEPEVIYEPEHVLIYILGVLYDIQIFKFEEDGFFKPVYKDYHLFKQRHFIPNIYNEDWNTSYFFTDENNKPLACITVANEHLERYANTPAKLYNPEAPEARYLILRFKIKDLVNPSNVDDDD